MPKVNTDQTAAAQVHHEVGEVAVSDAQHILAHGQSRQRAHAVGTEGEERLWARGQLQEGSSENVCGDAFHFLLVLLVHFFKVGFPEGEKKG